MRPPATSRGDVHFIVDAAGFATDDSTTRQEVYIQIPSPELEFNASGDALIARIEVEFTFSDTATGAVVLEKTMTADLPAATEAETHDRAEVHVLASEFFLSPGYYVLDVRLKDLQKRRSVIPLLFLRRNASGRATLALNVTAFADSRFHVSDLEFAREISDTAGTGEDNPFQKGRLSVVPCPERLYGLLIPDLSVYFEIYDPRGAGEHGEGAALSCEIRNDDGATVLSRREDLMLQEGNRWAKSLAFDLSQLPAGRYTTQVRIDKLETGETVKAAGEFDVVWSLFSWNKDLDELLQEMSSIASTSERDRLKELTTGEREIFLDQFWKRLDPTPETPRNEALEEHYQRIRVADRVFRGRVRGSRSDRGRIFVKFGQPDEINTGFATDEFIGDLPFLRRNQFDFDKEGRAKGGINYENKAYETWSYDQRGKTLGLADHGGTGLGLRFVFVDLSGYGDYRLVHSSENVQ
ncbi:MAG: GWxTD domain-containing protein [bacterium]